MLARIIFTLLALGLAWFIGLILFIRGLDETAPPSRAAADGVVVYTGGGARIAAGMELMEHGAAQRLLISGVNPEISRDEIAKMWPGAVAVFDCCVDLGAEAKTTVGNATEVSRWAHDHGFDSLILVTSDYHMPRALVETRARLPRAEIVAYAVPSSLLDEEGNPADSDAWRALSFEYSKYLAARVTTLAPRA